MTRYGTIVADPPWDYGVWRSTTDAAYPTMSLDDLRALPVRSLGDGAAHLYCWAVLPLMAEAFDVVRGWGFKPYTMLTWCKPGVKARASITPPVPDAAVVTAAYASARASVQTGV
jgi:N6-adenosine-specific RNA methylase IME4